MTKDKHKQHSSELTHRRLVSDSGACTACTVYSAHARTLPLAHGCPPSRRSRQRDKSITKYIHIHIHMYTKRGKSEPEAHSRKAEEDEQDGKSPEIRSSSIGSLPSGGLQRILSDWVVADWGVCLAALLSAFCFRSVVAAKHQGSHGGGGVGEPAPLGVRVRDAEDGGDEPRRQQLAAAHDRGLAQRARSGVRAGQLPEEARPGGDHSQGKRKLDQGAITLK
eukprot:1183369-Prorocentrum_minimum.AAC.3